MPLPKPTLTESRDVFMNRCMSDDTMNEEYPRNNQRFAVCNNLFSNKTQRKKYSFNYKKFRRAFSIGFKKLFRSQEKINFKIAKKYYQEGFNKSIDAFLDSNIPIKDNYVEFFNKQNTQQMYIDIYVDTGVRFQKWYMDNYKNFIKKQIEVEDNVIVSYFTNYAVNSTVTKQTSVQATALKNVETLFTKMLEDEDFKKDSFEGKSRRLHKELDKRALWEARRVVKTETTLASNLAVNNGATTLFKPEELMKDWIIGFSQEHRAGHLALDRSDPIPFNDNFVNPETGQVLPFPGQGIASEVINCSCSSAPFPKPDVLEETDNRID